MKTTFSPPMMSSGLSPPPAALIGLTKLWKDDDDLKVVMYNTMFEASHNHACLWGDTMLRNSHTCSRYQN